MNKKLKIWKRSIYKSGDLFLTRRSGEKGVPREYPDWHNERNQRFLIHIIPKTGIID